MPGIDDRAWSKLRALTIFLRFPPYETTLQHQNGRIIQFDLSGLFQLIEPDGRHRIDRSEPAEEMFSDKAFFRFSIDPENIISKFLKCLPLSL